MRSMPLTSSSSSAKDTSPMITATRSMLVTMGAGASHPHYEWAPAHNDFVTAALCAGFTRIGPAVSVSDGPPSRARGQSAKR
jgi:hypothetical protein